MNNIQIAKIFQFLHQNIDDLKIEKYKKDANRKHFLEHLKQAKKDIHLFGLNYPNYFTTCNHKIYDVLKYLDENKSNIEIYIYIPSLKVRDEISKLNIYPKNKDPKNIRVNIDLIKDFQQKFKNLKIKVIEYPQLYMIGLSAIDIETEDGFLHLAQVKRDELIEEAEYFDINYSAEYRPLFNMIKNDFLEKVKNENKN
jgi:hypothetical protein